MSAAAPVPAGGGIGAKGSAGSQGKDGVSRALLATHWRRAIGLLQRGTEAVLGFLDLTKQLGRSKASPLGVACP